MWTTRKFMITIIKMTSRLNRKPRIGPNQEPPNTVRKMATVIKVSSMDVTVMNITLTVILKATTTELKMMRMTCGDCNVDGMVGPCLCFCAYTMEYPALFI